MLTELSEAIFKDPKVAGFIRKFLFDVTKHVKIISNMYTEISIAQMGYFPSNF